MHLKPFFIKTLKNIAIRIVAILATIYVATAILLQFPAVQTSIAKSVTKELSKSINGRINIGKVYIVFFNKVILKDISIISDDRTPLLDSLYSHYGQSDTLLSCNKLSVSLSTKDLLKLKLKLNHIALESGVFNLQNEGGSGYTNLSRIFGIDRNKDKDTTKKGMNLNLLANSLRVRNFRFTLNNPSKYVDKGEGIINFSNLKVNDIDIDISNVKIERDTIFGKINNIGGRDHSGFTLAELSGDVEISSTETRIKDMVLSDSLSKIVADYFSMKYRSPKDLSDFTSLVKLGISLQDTYFNFATIGNIAPSLADSKLGLYLTGVVEGPVADLRSKSLVAISESGKTMVEIDVRMSGLPDIRETMSVVEVKRCYTTTEDLSKVVGNLNGNDNVGFFNRLARNIHYSFNGNIIGLPDDFVAHGTLRAGEINGSYYTRIGEIDLDILLRNSVEEAGFQIKGLLESKDLNVGKLIGNNSLGEVSMRSSMSAIIGKKRDISLSIDSVRVSRLHFNQYDYSNIFAIGKLDNNIFDGRIICHDPNLDFLFQGVITLDKQQTNRYNFYADVPYANLYKLNFDKRYSSSIIKFRSIVDFTLFANNNIEGNINLLNTVYTNSNGEFNIGTIRLNSTSTDSLYTATLSAPFVNAQYSATAPFTSFVRKIGSVTMFNNTNSYLFKDEGDKKAMFTPKSVAEALKDGNWYNFSLTTFNTGSVCQLIMPGSYIQDSTKVSASITPENEIDIELLSGRLAVGHNYLKGLDFKLDNRDSLLKMHLLSDEIRVAGMRLDSSKFALKGGDGKFNADFSFKNDTTGSSYANFNTDMEFFKDSVVMGIGSESAISLKGNRWEFSPAIFKAYNESLEISNFSLFNKEQHLMVNGILSKSGRDSVEFALNRFDVKIFNLFLNKPFNVEGYFSGNATLSSYDENTNVLLDITGDSVYVYKNPVGTMKIMSKWYNPEKRFNLLISSKLNGKSNLMVRGYYRPEDKYVNLTGELEELSVAYFEPFLSSIISKSHGSFSGALSLSGEINELKLTGENCRFNDFGFLLNYTQVPYTLDGTVTLDENGVFADNLSILDNFGNRGRVTGGMKYHYFRDPELDTRIDFQRLQCLKTTERDNEMFYGNAFASGSINIDGPFNNLLLDLNVVPAQNTELHIPLSSTENASQTNLLTFKEPAAIEKYDPYEKIMQKSVKKSRSESQIAVKLRANMNTNANMFLEINKSLGDVIKANGSGPISLDINPSKDLFDMFGDYNINQGNYKFVLSGFGFAAKDFIIQPGGVIHFNGDISNTTINLTATYRTKAAINTLIADTSSVSTRRTVNCEIMMSGNLMNPELKFNIDIPDLDPTTKVRVESALNTEGKIQKQFAALLISGGFLPDEQSGITNNSTILYSNVSEMLSNQINNIFQQLGIPLDLGFNYQPGEKGTTDIFDVAVSTQLFNNRLLINGNIGNDPYESTNNRSVIGNVDVEYKLDKSGKLRMSLFSHAADQYSNYLDDSQRSGVGVSYQQEFYRFKDIFRKKSPEQKEYDARVKALKREERKKRALERKEAKLSKKGEITE